MVQLRASGTRSSDTPCLSAAIFPLSAGLSNIYFSHELCFPVRELT